jgi:hypothetical protein
VPRLVTSLIEVMQQSTFLSANGPTDHATSVTYSEGPRVIYAKETN